MDANEPRARVAKMIRDAIEGSSKTFSSVGRALKVSHASVSFWASGKNLPDAKRYRAIADELGIDADELLQAIKDAEMADGPPALVVSGRLLPSNMVPAKAVEFDQLGPADIPVYGVVAGGTDAEFHLNGEVISRVRRPPAIEGLKEVYALHVVGSSMHPRFKDGELVYVQRRTPHIGDDVVLQLRGLDAASPDRGFIKYLIRRSASVIVCGQYNPGLEIEYAREEIISVDRVIPWHELLGA